jgi:hypothetical protein
MDEKVFVQDRNEDCFFFHWGSLRTNNILTKKLDINAMLRSLKKIRLLANLLSNSSSRNSLVDEMTSERLPFPLRFHVKAIENSFCHDYPPVYQLCVKVATTVIHMVIRVIPMIPPIKRPTESTLTFSSLITKSPFEGIENY